MGCGKTTVGKLLAEKSKARFIDLDDAIEHNTNKSINNIFSNQGEEIFRMEEQRALFQTSFDDKIVVACGGGTPCFGLNMKLIEQYGISIYLECTNETLYERLSKEKSKRPLIKDLEGVVLKEYIANKLKERKPYYEKANLIVNANVKLDEIYKQILACYMN